MREIKKHIITLCQPLWFHFITIPLPQLIMVPFSLRSIIKLRFGSATVKSFGSYDSGSATLQPPLPAKKTSGSNVPLEELVVHEREELSLLSGLLL